LLKETILRILLDQGTPVALRHALAKHVVVTAYEQGWSLLTNGDLIKKQNSKIILP